MRRALVGAVIAAIALTGCGNTDSGSNTAEPADVSESAGPTPTPVETPSEEPSDEPSDEPGEEPSDEPSDDDAIEVEIEGDKITPNGKRIKVKTGQVVTLEIDSDRPGELHIHSTPEQELAFGKGMTKLKVTIDTPGVVDVEEHEAGIVLLQLEVS